MQTMIKSIEKRNTTIHIMLFSLFILASFVVLGHLPQKTDEEISYKLSPDASGINPYSAIIVALKYCSALWEYHKNRLLLSAMTSI